MKTEDLIRALRRGSIDRHRCLGCSWENNCSIHGCRVMKEAAERLERLHNGLHRLEQSRAQAKGIERAILTDVLQLLGGDANGQSKA